MIAANVCSVKEKSAPAPKGELFNKYNVSEPPLGADRAAVW